MDQDYYINLIYKQLKGIISDEETTQLNTWQESSTENRAYAEGIRQAWKGSQDYEVPFELDLEKDYAQLQNKIAQSKTPQAIKQLPVNQRKNIWWQIAAALAVVLIAGFLLRNFLSPSEKWISQTAQNDILEIELVDGSIVFLNEGSTLSYPEKFSATERLTKLEGEAFFKVKKDKTKAFRVHSADLKVEVLGTAFNVKDQIENGQAVVSVEEGKVSVTSPLIQKEVILVAQESAFLKNKQLEKIQDSNLNALAWKRKRLSFSETQLETVINDIAQHYQLEITLDNPFIDDCLFSGRFNTDLPIENIFKILNEIYEIEVQKVNEQSYLLIGGTCK